MDILCTLIGIVCNTYTWTHCCGCSVTKSCPTLCNPMDCSTRGFPVLHCLLEFAQTQVHWIGDAIQPSHPLSPSSPVLNLSQRQRLFQWISSSHQVAKLSELQLQHQSFQWIFRTDFLSDWLVWSCRPRDSQESFPTPQFKSINSSALSFLHSPTLTSIYDHWKNHSLDYGQRWTFVGKVMSLLFNMLSKFVIAFLPRSKRLLISWLQSPSAWFWRPPKKVCYSFHIYLAWSDGTRCHDLRFLNVEF